MRKAVSDLLLLDNNALLALAWPNHQFHRRAIFRLSSSGQPWATCALTETSFLRLSINPTVVGEQKTFFEAVALLRELLSDPLHVYLAELPSPTSSELVHLFRFVQGHKQVPDAYLLALAHYYGATFLTFDRKLKQLAGPEVKVEVLAAS